MVASFGFQVPKKGIELFGSAQDFYLRIVDQASFHTGRKGLD
jgi:hypothetical protein